MLYQKSVSNNGIAELIVLIFNQGVLQRDAPNLPQLHSI